MQAHRIAHDAERSPPAQPMGFRVAAAFVGGVLGGKRLSLAAGAPFSIVPAGITTPIEMTYFRA
jgi:hypothetical protein